ncbi:STAS domain-containing protein [Nocardioides panacis]|uniref:STAS domain-containing protein n=1 Tax=Nocardioides panacis TaxID=2849501 RepID=A0A975T0W4_9ACTN|nr:STAS domain-containing protein [Nocardioides panacis]QWZ09451.1 STAS domain-containing protein [Nocardioides panacis]
MTSDVPDATGLTVDTLGPDDGTLTLQCRGELDYSTVRLLREHAEAALTTPAPTVVLDLDRVSFLDSAGLGTLVEIHRQLQAEGRTMVLQTSHANTLRVLETTGMTGFFTVRPG